MAKKVILNDRIKTALNSRGVTDHHRVAVFECTAASTRPISQKWSIYNDARMTPQMLKAMSSYLETESVPLQLMHSSGLPAGQLLFADTFENGFDTELNALFYLDANDELSEKIELGIIDEVSIGAEAKHVRCSSCGFDFFESDKRKTQLMWERTCDNEHTLGQDGVHLILDGVAKWSETSLVAKGASSKPKILPVDQQRLATDDSYRSLAASGINPNVFTLHASVEQTTTTHQDDDMDAKDLLDKLQLSSVELGTAQAKSQTLEAQLTTATTQIETLKTELAAANVAPSEKLTELEVALAAKDTELLDVKSSETQARNFIHEHYVKASAVLSQDVKENASLDDMIAVVSDARIALHQIPVGGQSLGADVTQPVAVALAASAFQTKR